MSGAIGKLAFDSIVQRNAPDANQGRAFAQFETKFQLAWVMAGIVPVLLPIPGRPGERRAVCEVLLANDAVRKRIRKGETHQIHQEITLGKASGMVTLEEALAAHVRDGLAAREEAAAWARHPEEFAKFLEGR